MNGSEQPPPRPGWAILGFLLQAAAILSGILAIASGGCVLMERNTGAREAFVFWGALKVFGISALMAGLAFLAALYAKMGSED